MSLFGYHDKNDKLIRKCLDIIRRVEKRPECQYVYVDLSNLSKYPELTIRSRLFAKDQLIFVVHEQNE